MLTAGCGLLNEKTFCCGVLTAICRFKLPTKCLPKWRIGISINTLPYKLYIQLTISHVILKTHDSDITYEILDITTCLHTQSIILYQHSILITSFLRCWCLVFLLLFYEISYALLLSACLKYYFLFFCI